MPVIFPRVYCHLQEVGLEQRLATQLKDLILKKIVGMWWEAWLCPVTTLGAVKCKVSTVTLCPETVLRDVRC